MHVGHRVGEPEVPTPIGRGSEGDPNGCSVQMRNSSVANEQLNGPSLVSVGRRNHGHGGCERDLSSSMCTYVRMYATRLMPNEPLAQVPIKHKKVRCCAMSR